MKKISIMLIGALLFLGGVAFAGDTSTDHFNQSGISYDHKHDTPGFGAGIGADVVVYKTDSAMLEEVVIENRLDIKNSEYRVFVVAKMDLWDAVNKNKNV